MFTLSRAAVAIIAACVLSGASMAAEFGDADRGAAKFKKDCSKCHQVGEGAKNRVGPELNGVFGRAAASVEGFKYSKGLKREGSDGLIWTIEKLDAYIANPRALVSKTRMSYRGMKDADDRADLLAYLRIFSDDPQNIPEAEPTANAPEVEVDPAVLALIGDPDYGEYLSSECTTCHQTDGGDDGIPSIVAWPVEDFVVAMHAYREKVRPHPVMQMMAGRLSNEEIAGLAAYFATLE